MKYQIAKCQNRYLAKAIVKAEYQKAKKYLKHVDKHSILKENLFYVKYF